MAAPILLLAYPSGPPAGYTGAPKTTVDTGYNCTFCHGGSAKAGGVTVSGFPTGSTYTPGVVQHLTVTVPTSSSGRGFELTARQATNTVTPAGTFKATDGNTQVIYDATNTVPFIAQTQTGSSATNTFNFDWTPPSSGVGDIVFYVAGVSGFSNVSTNVYTLTQAAPPPPLPTLVANPPSLTFSYQSGGSAPASQTFTVSSSDASAVDFSASASGGSWLSVSPTSGTTGSTGALTVAVNPSGLSASTYKGTVTITSAGASNTLTVGVTLTVTAPPAGPTLSASPTSLTFTSRNWLNPQTVTVSSSGAAINYTITANTAAGEPIWLSASCGSVGCTTPDTVTVSVSNTTALAPGTHYGSVKLTPTDTSIAEVVVRVKIRVPHH